MVDIQKARNLFSFGCVSRPIHHYRFSQLGLVSKRPFEKKWSVLLLQERIQKYGKGRIYFLLTMYNHGVSYTRYGDLLNITLLVEEDATV